MAQGRVAALLRNSPLSSAVMSLKLCGRGVALGARQLPKQRIPVLSATPSCWRGQGATSRGLAHVVDSPTPMAPPPPPSRKFARAFTAVWMLALGSYAIWMLLAEPDPWDFDRIGEDDDDEDEVESKG